MNLKRFTGRNTKEAMAKVREAYGKDAVVVSTRHTPNGVEIVAMAPDSVASLERWETRSAPLDSRAPTPSDTEEEPELSSDPVLDVRPEPRGFDAAAPRTPSRLAARLATRIEAPTDVNADVEKLAMSTLSFQEYVRERMLKRRKAALRQEEQTQRDAAEPVPPTASALERRLSERVEAREATPAKVVAFKAPADRQPPAPSAPTPSRPASRQPLPRHPNVDLAETGAIPLHTLTEAPADPRPLAAVAPAAPAPREDHSLMLHELRAMKGLIEDRFGALAFMEKLQRSPVHARLIQKLLDCGFTPGLVRKLADGLAEDVTDEMAWAGTAIERNLVTDEGDTPIEDTQGVFALIGSTGVGKTTTTAKIAAAFAARHGAAALGLITLDAYRLAAHEQLRAYGRILGVPVHTAHDRTALEDLLDLLSNKKMVLIDTAGMAQRDARTKDLLDMLAHPSVKRLLVVNAASQGETIDDVLQSYRAAQAHGVILSKVDEAVKLAPALDALIRHKLKIRGIANGQRVPEDWHHLSASALVQRALKAHTGRSYRIDASEVKLVFTAPQANVLAGDTASSRDVR
jgi:flagellar biosynthesis protein FlhF